MSIKDRVFNPVTLPAEPGVTSHPKRRWSDAAASPTQEAVEVVIILLAHDGVRIPAAWEQLHSDGGGRLDFVVYVEGEGAASLTPFLNGRRLPAERLPCGHTTSWADPGVFEVQIVGMEYALEVYSRVHTLYVAPGNSIPVQSALGFLDSSLAFTCLGIPLSSHQAQHLD